MLVTFIANNNWLELLDYINNRTNTIDYTNIVNHIHFEVRNIW